MTELTMKDYFKIVFVSIVLISATAYAGYTISKDETGKYKCNLWGI